MRTGLNSFTTFMTWLAMGLSTVAFVISSVQIYAWADNLDSSMTVTSVNKETDVSRAYKILQEYGGEDVEIVVTDSQLNCALWDINKIGIATRSKSPSGEEIKNGGCWRSQTPDKIYLSSSLGDGETLRYVTIHEYMHVLQHRGDVPTQDINLAPHMDADTSLECLADIETANRGDFDSNYLTYISSGKCEEFTSLLEY